MNCNTSPKIIIMGAVAGQRCSASCDQVRSSQLQRLHPSAQVLKGKLGRFCQHGGSRLQQKRERHQLHSPCSAESSAAGMAQTSPEQEQAPGNVFARVVGPTALALLVCNMDRICMSIAILPMSQEFGWPQGVQGLVQSGFLWGYMATQMIGGALADKHGGRLVMANSIFWFSLASLLMPAALSSPVRAARLTVPAVMLARGLVGLAEGVALPSMSNLVATAIPKARRSSALGGSFSGFHSGNLVGLALSPFLLARLGWRGLFVIFGAVGFPLLALWLAVVPKPAGVPGLPQLSPQPGREQVRRQLTAEPRPLDTPQPLPKQAAPAPADPSHALPKQNLPTPALDATSLEAPKVTTLSLLKCKAVWAIIIVNFVNHWGYFIYLAWIPTFFVRTLGVNLRSSSFLSFLPWTVMAVGSSVAGVLADGLIQRGWSVTHVRKALQTVAFLGPAAALMVLSGTKDPRIAVASMTCALGITSLGQAAFVANMSDIAPRRAGQLFGLANTFGSAAGIIGTSAVGFVVEKTGSFNPIFKLTAVMYVFAVIIWNLLCSGEQQFD